MKSSHLSMSRLLRADIQLDLSEPRSLELEPTGRRMAWVFPVPGVALKGVVIHQEQ